MEYSDATIAIKIAANIAMKINVTSCCPNCLLQQRKVPLRFKDGKYLCDDCKHEYTPNMGGDVGADGGILPEGLVVHYPASEFSMLTDFRKENLEQISLFINDLLGE